MRVRDVLLNIIGDCEPRHVRILERDLLQVEMGLIILLQEFPGALDGIVFFGFRRVTPICEDLEQVRNKGLKTGATDIFGTLQEVVKHLHHLKHLKYL